MNADDVAGVLRIDDPEVDVDAILARIRANLAGREGLGVDTAALLRRFGAELGQPSTRDLDFVIGCLRLILDTPLPSQRIRATRTFADRLLNRLRRPMHDLVRFYVDAQAARQTEIAWLVYDALASIRAAQEAQRAEHGPPTHELVARADALADDAAALRDELTALRQELAELRARGTTGPA